MKTFQIVHCTVCSLVYLTLRTIITDEQEAVMGHFMVLSQFFAGRSEEIAKASIRIGVLWTKM
jgi:hypothetical protein